MNEFSRQLQQITSKKGWARATYDKRIWVPCPRGLPEGWDHERWAGEFSAAWWALAGLPHGESDLTKLATLLDHIYVSTWGQDAEIPCHLAYIHLPDPRMLPMPVYLAVLQALDEKDTELRRLTQADDPAVIEPPIAEEFTTDNLGRGLRVLRHWQGDDDGEVDAGLSYAWRSERYETDLRLFTATSDLGRLQQAIPDIDELARQIVVVPSET
jgi:hypothetical protein